LLRRVPRCSRDWNCFFTELKEERERSKQALLLTLLLFSASVLALPSHYFLRDTFLGKGWVFAIAIGDRPSLVAVVG
jgi:hypothetical protein